MHFIYVIQLLLFMSNKTVKSSKFFGEHWKDSQISIPNISDLIPMKNNSEGQCSKLQCKYLCINGTHASLERDVNTADDNKCKLISDLHLLNYQFPRNTLPKNFLGSIANKVNFLTIQSSKIEYIEPGAFESETLTGVRLEDLELKSLDKGVFKNVNEQFTKFTLIQNNSEIKLISECVMDYIKYQLKELKIQTGLRKIESLTCNQSPLNSLDEIDLSYNNFGASLSESSFNQLSVVQKLSLSHSQITFLPEFIFDSIVVTLRMLDLSNNKLQTIDRNIFGWRIPTKVLTLYLNENPWECSCYLQKEMKVLLAFQTKNVYCGNMKNTLVTSDKICSASITSTTVLDNSTEIVEETTTEDIHTTESLLPSSTSSDLSAPTTTHDLECHKDNDKLETENLSIHWPNTQFDIIKKKIPEVDIVVKNFNETYGVLWFSKVTLLYYKMETNHNEYGLGCYGRVEHVTTIKNLLPDMSYTFCLIMKDQLTVSPFSCKSVYIDGNLDINYNAWLTTNMKATGISVMIIGCVLFMFMGVFFAFIFLKHKPSLLKGSKRVATQKTDESNIFVFPEHKTLKEFKLMEEKLAITKFKGFAFPRISSASAHSLESIQSYMNPENINIYEVIPSNQCSRNDKYVKEQATQKRSSNDPLPEVPHKVKENIFPRFGKNFEVSVGQDCEAEGCLYI